MKLITIVMVFGALTLQAKEKSGSHHDHSAHVHGAATVNIAFDGLVGKIEFNAAANGVVGFEHEAKSKKDKARLKEAEEKFVSGRNKIFNFDPTLECTIKEVTVGLELEKETPEEKEKSKVHSEHADFKAIYDVTCKKSPLNTKLTLDFTAFKLLKDIDATILIGDLQKAIEIKKKPVSIELK